MVVGSFDCEVNVDCGRNVGLESSLRAMAATEMDVGIFTETKITDGVTMSPPCHHPVTASQGGISPSLEAKQGNTLAPLC